MKIEKYVSSQYAGMSNQCISFQPGMNVVLGDNETGKSTMISGIMDTLLMSAKLDRRSDKDFIQRRFPTNDANFIDGEVRLVLRGEKVAIKKEWDKKDFRGSRTILQYLESGKKVTGATAEEELKKLLRYGDAVYQKIIFGRQDNEEEILNWLFSFLQEGTEDDLTEVKKQVIGAAAAAGGISEELFLTKLEGKLDQLGSRWDFDLDRPEGGRGLSKRWQNKVGSILAAYYAWQETSEAYEQGEALIRETSETEQKLYEQREKKQQLTARQEALQKQRTAIQTAGLLHQQKNSLIAELKKLSDDKGKWPKLRQEKKLLDGLIAEDDERLRRKDREALEMTLAEVKKCDADIATCQKAMDGKESIETDSKVCRTLQNDLNGIEVQLATARLTTRVMLQGEYQADVETADGQAAKGVGEFNRAVSGYAKVTIPGVGEVMVTPGDLDVDGLKRKREETLIKRRNILERYGLQTCDELEQAASAYRESRDNLERYGEKRERLLAGRTLEEIAAALQELEISPGLVVGDNLDQRIQDALSVCRETTLGSRHAVVMQQLTDLETENSSYEEMENRQKAANEALTKVKDELAQIGEVSMTQEEYDREVDTISNGLKTMEDALEATIREYANLAKEADEIDLEELQTEQIALTEQLNHQKRLYHQYSKIKQDFLRIKEGQADQYGEFYALFNRYLSAAAGDALYISPENAVVSKTNTLPGKEFLSQGTRQVILLAFRLALLKYYYPAESGVVVLDDILLDMDPHRRAEAANLLSAFAKDNQVIFTTCDPAIAELLGGNLIQM